MWFKITPHPLRQLGAISVLFLGNSSVKILRIAKVADSGDSQKETISPCSGAERGLKRERKHLTRTSDTPEGEAAIASPRQFMFVGSLVWFAERVRRLQGTARNAPVALRRRPLNVVWRCWPSLRCNMSTVLSSAYWYSAAAGEITLSPDGNVWRYRTLHAFLHFLGIFFLFFPSFRFPLISSSV